jgi:class 3 adenylate cyclase
MPKPLDDILAAVTTETATVLNKNPPVDDVDPDDLDADDLPDAKNLTWYRLDRVVAVFADMKNSTQLSVGKHPRSTAAIYRAATGNVVKVFHDLDADFIQIQGDGAFGLFWGDLAIERAICAGITIKTFSEKVLQPKLESRWPDAPATGFKVGVATGRTLIKNIGTPRNSNEQEPVWVGKPVNHAAKAAQQADRNELIVTGSVWLEIEHNDYLTQSCGHNGGAPVTPAPLWDDVEIEKLGHDNDDAAGRVLTSCWCDECGPGFMAAILAGDTDRNDVPTSRGGLTGSAAVAAATFARRRERLARQRGIKHVTKRR